MSLVLVKARLGFCNDIVVVAKCVEYGKGISCLIESMEFGRFISQPSKVIYPFGIPCMPFVSTNSLEQT